MIFLALKLLIIGDDQDKHQNAFVDTAGLESD